VPQVKKERTDNKEFAKELEKRTRKFAASIIYLSSQLPNSPEGKAIRNQITKSGTSIGANYREANRARSNEGSIKLQALQFILGTLPHFFGGFTWKRLSD
jgi:hypothetical protein